VQFCAAKFQHTIGEKKSFFLNNLAESLLSTLDKSTIRKQGSLSSDISPSGTFKLTPAPEVAISDFDTISYCVVSSLFLEVFRFHWFAVAAEMSVVRRNVAIH
jgi:hypothetical protein